MPTWAKDWPVAAESAGSSEPEVLSLSPSWVEEKDPESVGVLATVRVSAVASAWATGVAAVAGAAESAMSAPVAVSASPRAVLWVMSVSSQAGVAAPSSACPRTPRPGSEG